MKLGKQSWAKCCLCEKWLVPDTELKINVQVLRKIAYIGSYYMGIVSVCVTSAEKVWVSQG